MPAKPRALVLSPETPYPLHGGGALRTASLLHYLARTHELDLIVFRHRQEQDPIAALPQGLISRTLVIDLPFHSKDFFSRAVRNAGRLVRRAPPLIDRFRGFTAPIEDFTQGFDYRVAVIEHFWCAEYRTVLRAQHVVLNLHNLESALHQSCAKAEQGYMKLVHATFGNSCRALECQWLPRFAEILTASSADAARVRDIAPHTPVTVFPNSIPCLPQPRRVEEHLIAFSGNLEYHPNQVAVRFFARQIWPELHRANPGLRWRLIGMNPEAVRATVAPYPGIELTGSVEDAVAALAVAQVVVVPLLSGSGTRLKIVEAWAAGRAVVSTPLGAEGLPAEPGVNILLAESAAEFTLAIQKLLDFPTFRHDLGRQGRLTFERHLSWEAAWRTLDRSCLAQRNF